MSIFRNGEPRRFTSGVASDRVMKDSLGWRAVNTQYLEDEDLVEMVGRLLERAEYEDATGAAMAVQRYFNEQDF